MAGGKEKKKEAEALFPDVWWQSPDKKEGITSAAADTPKCNNLQTIDNNNTNYGSLQYKSNTSSYNNITDVNIEEQRSNNELQEGRHSRTPSLIEQLIEQPSELLESLVDSCNSQILTLQRNINGEEDDTSDISNQSSNSNNSGSDDDNSCDSDDSSQYYDEIEQPHRTLGLIFFDFIRFVAISANLRCVNTQLMPVFMCYGKKCEIDLLSVVLR